MSLFRQEIMTFSSQYSRITWFIYSLFIKAHQSWIIITIMTHTEWWRCQIPTLSIRKRKKKKKNMVFGQEILTCLSPCTHITRFIYSLFIKAYQSWINARVIYQKITIITHTEGRQRWNLTSSSFCVCHYSDYYSTLVCFYE